MKTKQETFDLVAKHLLTQGGPSTFGFKTAGTTCAYRGQNGRKCAAGILIPDELYTPGMEGKPAHGQDVRGVLTELGYNPSFVRDLQMAHDECELSWGLIKNSLETVAMQHGLSMKVLDETELVLDEVFK